MPSPLDEYPLHQIPRPIAEVGTSDRNFYDRSYFNAHDGTGALMLVTGLGVYPNLGVADAYAVVRRGDRQHAVRFSGPLFEDRLDQRVGPYRIEVLEPLQRLRLTCDAEQLGVGFELEWRGTHPAVDEERHLMRGAHRLVIESHRFAQVGTWQGQLVVDGDRVPVDDERWIGTRDRSWGIRPVGEPEPAGRPADGEPSFWWTYVPLRFDRFALLVIAQERADGSRTLSEAVRVFPDGRVEQLGWPEFQVRYRSGTRLPESARLTIGRPSSPPLVVDIDCKTAVALHIGAGYGADPDWSHGVWRGADYAECVVYDLTEPATAARIPFGVVDHAAVAVVEGEVGAGLFEHACVGRHDPSGFRGLADVAP
jgi:hypothetical protein